MSKEPTLVIAHSASSPAEAEIVRVVLEDAGIVALVENRNVPLPGIDLTPFDAESGLAGCDVRVSSADAARARSALAEARERGLMPEGEDADYGEEEDAESD